MIRLGSIVVAVLLLAGCSSKQEQEQATQEEENREAKALMQGLWADAETEDVSFRVAGDTIFYADSTSMPAYFKIVGDSLTLSSGTSYAIENQTEHVFSFRNQNGDLITLHKIDEAEADSLYVTDTKPTVMTYTHQVKTDSTVSYNGARYHWYIAINPTRFKVVRRTFNDDGMEVENVYYDNIMHISVYNGAHSLYSSDFRKQQYMKLVPANTTSDTRSPPRPFSRLATMRLLRSSRFGCMSSAIMLLEISRQMATSLPFWSPCTILLPTCGFAQVMMSSANASNSSVTLMTGRALDWSGISRPNIGRSANRSSFLRLRYSIKTQSNASTGTAMSR